MKPTRMMLIRQAQKDHADEGTAWCDRLEKWLELLNENDPRNYKQVFLPPYEVSGLNFWQKQIMPNFPR